MSRWQWFWQNVVLYRAGGAITVPIAIMFYGWLIGNEVMVWMMGVLTGEPVYALIGAALILPTVMRAFYFVEMAHDLIWLTTQRYHERRGEGEFACDGACCKRVDSSQL